ncbi:BQ2448_4776 [Microbotryum intermedium]|uniref:BQ2448_4776 protein n=1 Tax=Microbotryum intermedium TaxID=269621 RepID=A0A238FE32_9BASI|nr:BQ2448_4776 [Microbotryum intermedium]
MMASSHVLSEAELATARARLSFLERSRAHQALEQMDGDSIRQETSPERIAESRRALLEIMTLARKVYSHSSFVMIPSIKSAIQVVCSRIREAWGKHRLDTAIFLLGRIISRPHRNRGDVVFAFEDRSGIADMLHVSDWPLGPITAGTELGIIFPLGQVIGVKIASRLIMPISAFLFCPSPTDMVMLEPSHPLVRGATWTAAPPGPVPSLDEDYKALGNAAFARKQWRGAIKLYSTGIDLDALKVIELVEKAPKSQLESDPDAIKDWLEKAWCRRAVAEERACNLELARVSYRKVKSFGRTLKAEAEQSIARVELMLKQSRTGEHYPWLELYERSLRTDEDPRMPAGSYIGPIRVVDKLDGRGVRGTIATRDIQVGVLVLAEKSVVSACSVAGFPKEKLRFPDSFYHLQRNAFFSKLLDDPAMAKTLFRIRPGKATGQSIPMPQDFQANFSVPTTLPPGEAWLDDTLVHEVFQQISCQGFSVAPGPRDVFPPRPISGHNDNDDEFRFLRVSPHLSSLNYSCFPNTTIPVRFGDLTIVRAREFIPAGKELTSSKSTTPYEHLTRKILKLASEQRGQGECGCVCCAYDQKGDVFRITRRRSLLESDPHLISRESEIFPCDPQTRLEELLKLVKALDETYSVNRGPARPEIAQLLWRLGNVMLVAHRFGRPLDNSGSASASAEFGRPDARWSNHSKIQIDSLGISSDVTTLLCIALHMFTTLQQNAFAGEPRAWLDAAIDGENLTFGMVPAESNFS